MVGSIIEAERNDFKDYGGGLYDHPKVKAVAGEGRSYLRSTDKKYDIIQMFSKLIGFPTHTLVVVISTMLIFAGIGSAYSKRQLEKSNNHTFIFTIIIAYLVAFVLTFEWLFYALLGLPLTARILCAIVMIAPLAFLLGMPFPIGIMSLSGSSNYAVPWVWAINGFFTVLGGFLAIIISIISSFATVLLISAAIYGIAMIVARSHSDRLKNENFALASKAT
jgi:hypothetical protein